MRAIESILLAGLLAGLAFAQQGPTVQPRFIGPVDCKGYIVDRTNVAFKAAATTANVTLFTLPGANKVIGVNVKHSAQFSDGTGAMTDVSVSAGSTASDTSYSSATSIGEVSAVADTTFQDTAEFKSATNIADAVHAHFIATARNFGAVSQAVTAATNAAAAQLTHVGHGLLTGAQIVLTGATGAWTPINGTWSVTTTGADTFTISVNSTTFGALAGSPVYNATFLTGGSVTISVCTVRLR